MAYGRKVCCDIILFWFTDTFVHAYVLELADIGGWIVSQEHILDYIF